MSFRNSFLYTFDVFIFIFFFTPSNLSAHLVDGHAASHLGLDVLEADRVEVGSLLGFLGLEDVLLETSAKVAHANDGVDNGQDDEEDGDDSEGRQRLPHGHVELPVVWLVDAHELEDEVAQATEVQNDDNDHTDLLLSPGEESGADENRNGNRDGGSSQSVLHNLDIAHDDKELDGESEEEEEIEFKESDVDLVIQESLLHPVVSSDRLEDIPSKDLVQLPGNKGHGKGAGGEDAGNGDQEGAYLAPQVLMIGGDRPGRAHFLDGDLNLFDLDGGIDHDSQVGDADSNDLNGVLVSQSIPDDNELVEESENEQSEEGRDRTPLGIVTRLVLIVDQAILECGEDVGFENHANEGLAESDEEEAPRPQRGHEREPAFPVGALRARAIHSRGSEALAISIALVGHARRLIARGLRRLGLGRQRSREGR